MLESKFDAHPEMIIFDPDDIVSAFQNFTDCNEHVCR